MTKLCVIANVAGDDERRQLLKEIGELIAKVKSLDLPDSVFLLSMAQLDLKTKIHGINDEELEAFSRIIRSAAETH